MDTTQQFKDLLEAAVKETGVQLKKTPLELARYMNERATHLATLVGQAGFEKAVVAERNSVALEAGLSAHDQASALDWRIIGLIQGALRIAAAALA